MGIGELFKVQEKLDNNLKAVKELEGKDLKEDKITSALAGLYKCVNEDGYYKYWEEHNVPNTSEICLKCQGSGVLGYDTMGGIVTAQECGMCYGDGIFSNPILREYVQLLSFTVSVANDLKIENYRYTDKDFFQEEDTVRGMVISITELLTLILRVPTIVNMCDILDRVVRLGYLLGLEEEEVIQEYHINIRDRARELLEIQNNKRCSEVDKEKRERVEQAIASFYWEQEMKCMKVYA